MSKKEKKKSTLRIGDFSDFWFFLFNDILVYTTMPNSRGFCKLKYMLPLIDMEIVDVPDNVNPTKSKEHCHMFEIKSNVKGLILGASSQQDKIDWVQQLKEHIELSQKNAATLKASKGSTNSQSSLQDKQKSFLGGGEGS